MKIKDLIPIGLKNYKNLIKNKMKSNKLINSWVFFLVACIELFKKM